MHFTLPESESTSPSLPLCRGLSMDRCNMQGEGHVTGHGGRASTLKLIC